jgi:uncharacterized DUF497 family protein
MVFEFDKSKSKMNKKKHGIDFIEARALWEDPDRIEIPVKTVDEPRFIVIGTISDKHWSSPKISAIKKIGCRSAAGIAN